MVITGGSVDRFFMTLNKILEYVIRSKNSYKVFLIVFSCVLLFSASSASAGNMLELIQSSLPQLLADTTRKTLTVYFTLWGLDSASTAIFKYMLPQDYKGMFIFLFTRFFFIFIFTTILLKPTFYLAIIAFIGSIGSKQLSVGLYSLNGLDMGWSKEVFNDFMKALISNPLNILKALTGFAGMWYAVLTAIVYLCTVWIQWLYVRLLSEIYFVIYGAFILTGFVGSPLTRGLFFNYLNAVIGLGLRLSGFAFILIIVKQQYTNPMFSQLEPTDMATNLIMATLMLNFVPMALARLASGNAGGDSMGFAAGTMLGAGMAAATAGAGTLAQKYAGSPVGTIAGNLAGVMKTFSQIMNGNTPSTPRSPDKNSTPSSQSNKTTSDKRKSNTVKNDNNDSHTENQASSNINDSDKSRADRLKNRRDNRGKN